MTLVLVLVLTAVFMLGINLFSPALSFLRDGWFLPVFFAYIAVTSIYFYTEHSIHIDQAR